MRFGRARVAPSAKLSAGDATASGSGGGGGYGGGDGDDDDAHPRRPTAEVCVREKMRRCRRARLHGRDVAAGAPAPGGAFTRPRRGGRVLHVRRHHPTAAVTDRYGFPGARTVGRGTGAKGVASPPPVAVGAINFYTDEKGFGGTRPVPEYLLYGRRRRNLRRSFSGWVGRGRGIGRAMRRCGPTK